MDNRREGPSLYVADYVSGRYLPIEKIVPRRNKGPSYLRDGPTKMAAPPPIGGARLTPIVKEPPRSMQLKQVDNLEAVTRNLARKMNDVTTRDIDRMAHDSRWTSVSSAAARDVCVPVRQKSENNESLPHTNRFKGVQRYEPHPQPWQTANTDGQLRTQMQKVNFPYDEDKEAQLSQKEYLRHAGNFTTSQEKEYSRFFCRPYPGHTGYIPQLLPENGFPQPGPTSLGSRPTKISTMKASYREIPLSTARNIFAKEIPFSQWSRTAYPYKPVIQ